MLLMQKLFKQEMAEGGSPEEHFRELKEIIIIINIIISVLV